MISGMLDGPNYMGPESPCSKRAEAHFAFSKIPTETLGHLRFTLSLHFSPSPLRSLWKLLSLSLSKSRNFESGMIMDEDLDCVEHRSSSTQQEEVAGIAEEKHFKEQQETEVDENFLKLEESGKLKKISGNGNGSKENHLAGVQVQDCTEGLPTSSSSVVVVDENQELGNASKIEEKCLLGSVDEAEETRLVKSADSESFLVGSVNEAEQNHLVKSDDLESWNETVVKSLKTNSRHKSVEAGEKMVQNGDGGKVKPLRGKLKIEVIDDTAVIDSTSIPRSGNGCSRQKTKQETDERRDKRTRRKAKGGKQGLEANGKGKIVAQIVEAQKNESGTKRVYSRKEMEVLRYINSEEQRKMWMEIRCSLGPVVLKEYDGLENCTNHKRIRVNFDPRQQSAKKEEAPAILREVSSSNVDDEMQNLHPLDPSYGHSVDGKDSNADPEECSEDSDSDEDYSSIQRPAFLVEGEPDFDSGPPEDGLEYLRRVRWEAAQIPEVTVAKLDRNKLNKEQTLYMPKIPDIAKCPEHLAPLKKWEDAFLADFAELRAALSHLEDSRVENSDRKHPVFSFHEDYSCQVLESTVPENFDKLTIDSQPLDCSNPKNSDKRLPLSTINEDDTSFSPENSSPRTESSGNYPLLSVILGMDSVARVSMLRKCINSLETKSTLSRSDCMWLFALCAAIDTPLHADTCAALRSLLRKCASLRAEKSELDDEVVMLNILVTIAGRYFKQLEN